MPIAKKRTLFLGLLLVPAAFLLAAFVVARLWLNHRLERELVFGSVEIRMAAPNLGWNLNFACDSLQVAFPGSVVRVSALSTRWSGLLRFKPGVSVEARSVELLALSDTEKKPPAGPPVFPEIRFPIPVSVRVGRFELFLDGSPVFSVDGIDLRSWGFHGASLEAGAWRFSKGDSVFSVPAELRTSLRWSGKAVKYSLRAEAAGDSLRIDGRHLKKDLRLGRDSLDLIVAALPAYAPLFPGGQAPDLRGIGVHIAAETESRAAGRVRLRMRTPRLAVLGPQAVDLKVSVEDSAGALTLRSRGDSGESIDLRGGFTLPFSLRPSDLARWADSAGGGGRWDAFSASLSGQTRHIRIVLGNKRMPADATIRSLKIHPRSGPAIHAAVADAEIVTADGSRLRAQAFRTPDWRLVFSGQISDRESWAIAWTDTNVSFRDASVSGEFRRGKVSVDARIRGVKAFRAAADSVYATQHVNNFGYYLESSRVFGKRAEWGVTGNVEWRGPNGVLKKHTTLTFQARNPEHGILTYGMPRHDSIWAKVENANLDRVPYVPLEKFFRYRPTVSGEFEWNPRAKLGRADVAGIAFYQGKEIVLNAKGRWNARLLDLSEFGAAYAGSKLLLAGQLDLGGRQFFELSKTRMRDVRSVSLEADKFDAAGMASLLFHPNPIDSGVLNGKLAYNDVTGLDGTYEITGLSLRPLRKIMELSRVEIRGRGESLGLFARTRSEVYPWLNDSVEVLAANLLGSLPRLSLNIASQDGARLSFEGLSHEFRDLEGKFGLEGNIVLPGKAGELLDAGLGGYLVLPLGKGGAKQFSVRDGALRGRYAVAGADTQSFSGSFSVRDGKLELPDFRAEDRAGRSLKAELRASLDPLFWSARVRGDELNLRWQDMEKLQIKDLDVDVRADSMGLTAEGNAAKVFFQPTLPPVKIRGRLENVAASYRLPSAAAVAAGEGEIPRIKASAKLSQFLFQYKIGMREALRFFRDANKNKRKKRVQPVDLQVNLETVGSENRIETDILRMFFVGDLSLKGVYPYTLISGDLSALTGEVGQANQSYALRDFDLRWQNATLSEGRIAVEGEKKLKVDCKPETQRTCNVYIKLDGRLDEMAFTYDSDCGQNAGEKLEPSALINSVTRSCYSEDFVAGAGGGNYGDAVLNFLEPAINQNLSEWGSKLSGGWIKTTQVSGIGTLVGQGQSTDKTVVDESVDAFTVGVETKRKWGVSLKAKAGYYPEKKLPDPWEKKVALEWRPPLEKAVADSAWKRRLRDRFTVEASAETRPDEKKEEEQKQIMKQVGLRYHFKFWNLW